MADEKFMKIAIEKAVKGIKTGQTPFGACIVKDDEVISCAHSVVWDTIDITAHAEIHAIREACKKLNTIHLSGCTIYSTVEPCPMCFSAIHWARISRIVFGARIEDAFKSGFNELSISNENMKTFGGSPVEISGDFMKEECLYPFKLWSESPNKRAY